VKTADEILAKAVRKRGSGPPSPRFAPATDRVDLALRA
jgi:hypothetical protein